jgi:hypothetical protein
VVDALRMVAFTEHVGKGFREGLTTFSAAGIWCPV